MKKHIVALILLSLVSMPSRAYATAIENLQTNDISSPQEQLPICYDGRAYTSSIKNQKDEGLCWDYVANDLAYYYPGNSMPNHGSLIVGWDDTYSRENFNEACRPSGDGAFLVKNSWGTNWGKAGYFWISYETPLHDINAITEVGKNDFYDNIYEYDYHGMIGQMNASSQSLTSVYMNQYHTKEQKESYNIPIETNSEAYCSQLDTALKRGYIASDIEHMKTNRKYDVGEQGVNLCLKAFTRKINE